ncbi:hypothetical protein ACA910_002209 [Epithemia clementina (nom. ined.)]
MPTSWTTTTTQQKHPSTEDSGASGLSSATAAAVMDDNTSLFSPSWPPAAAHDLYDKDGYLLLLGGSADEIDTKNNHDFDYYDKDHLQAQQRQPQFFRNTYAQDNSLLMAPSPCEKTCSAAVSSPDTAASLMTCSLSPLSLRQYQPPHQYELTTKLPAGEERMLASHHKELQHQGPGVVSPFSPLMLEMEYNQNYAIYASGFLKKQPSGAPFLSPLSVPDFEVPLSPGLTVSPPSLVAGVSSTSTTADNNNNNTAVLMAATARQQGAQLSTIPQFPQQHPQQIVAKNERVPSHKLHHHHEATTNREHNRSFFPFFSLTSSPLNVQHHNTTSLEAAESGAAGERVASILEGYHYHAHNYQQHHHAWNFPIMNASEMEQLFCEDNDNDNNHDL